MLQFSFPGTRSRNFLPWVPRTRAAESFPRAGTDVFARRRLYHRWEARRPNQGVLELCVAAANIFPCPDQDPQERRERVLLGAG